LKLTQWSVGVFRKDDDTFAISMTQNNTNAIARKKNSIIGVVQKELLAVALELINPLVHSLARDAFCCSCFLLGRFLRYI
jgi:hypothetical protein